MPPEGQVLKKGVFTLSLDFELLWGTIDLFGPERFSRCCEIERTIVSRLLDLFVEFEISATWCTLGHLFLDSCQSVNGVAHPEIVPPQHGWLKTDWFGWDPCSNEANAPLFYARSLVDLIRRCPVRQELGSHSFSHVIFGDPGCSRNTARSEIQACVAVAQEMGIPLHSFAFPRNSVGHLDILRTFGFSSFRGADPTWYGHLPVPGLLKRLFHLCDVLLATTPRVGLPTRTQEQLWNIPGSMIYFPMHGFRRYIPLSLRVKRAKKGLDAAVKTKRIFHLWFHPTNMADQPEGMFAGLRQILTYAKELIAQGYLVNQTMDEIVDELTASSPKN